MGRGTLYVRHNRIWFDFRYMGERVRESSGLVDTRENRQILRRQLDLIMAEIDNGVFSFGKRFPRSRRRAFFAELEGREVTTHPSELLFGDYVLQWFADMGSGMTENQIRDYQSALQRHVLPYFRDLNFAEITSARMRKFIATMKGKRSEQGQPLSAKRIRNVIIPLRVIIEDCVDEYAWLDFPDPFTRCKLPRPRKFRVQPFSFEEWQVFITHISPWYRPYFEFAVQTGLRPSEQVALKWVAIDHEYIHIELSRVRGREKEDLKTHESRRRLLLRPGLRRILLRQRKLTAGINSPYVFVNKDRLPISQDKLRSVVWVEAFAGLELQYRRMYETRHTFASWALALGETPEWVAKTLGHVDTSMVYRTYGRYIPNLKSLDGFSVEKQFSGTRVEGKEDFGHSFGHNEQE
ncbi:Arm DNA-binding domain-containing protein [Desulfotalea psychrophila]|uniref:Related to pore-forming cytotoxin integrase n=1 Tax=Desulfotalea psychrophila (strain LSv54 / DSM 12343) TaxID=177439 RepID=Q6ALN4_DESPS|nr:DUF3596 domain-containing protein [Desulfotalea psychrophila]CAG36741.1 related to pore-forming cytotoxin integrase [Desulfotalea psychrophila LSv54]